MSTQTAAPFAEVADPGGDYELSIRLDCALNDYAQGIARQRVVVRSYALSGRREDGAGRLVVSPIVGEEENDAGEIEDVYGEPVLDLAILEASADPLALLRALLSGGIA